MDLMTIIAYLMGISMVGGAAAGWILFAVLLFNQYVTPMFRNLAPRSQPARAGRQAEPA